MSSSTNTSKAGVFLVSSGITAKEVLPLDIFNKWYDEVHIPDILGTSGVQTAYRFKATGADGLVSRLPFLALYLLQDVGWAADDNCEVWKIPIESDLIPTESKNIFALADFHTGLYEKVGSIGTGSAASAKNIVLVSVDPEQAAARCSAGDLEGLLSDSVAVRKGKAPARSTLFKWTYAPPHSPKPEERDAGSSLITPFFVMHEFEDAPTGELVGKNEEVVRGFNQLSSFGDVTKTW